MTDLFQHPWSCLERSGLAVFAITAEQRYLLGEDLFLATHLPITLCRFPPGRPPETIGEIDLLARLLYTPGVQPGNRIFVLYGAPGSGKSELMRWLQIMTAQQDSARAEVTIRISRTELNALRIAERFHHVLTQTYFSETTYRQWEEAQRKPRTVTKLLLLTALERCLDSDEQINALYYRLLPWIEPRIAHILTAVDIEAREENAELLTREDLEQMKAETALPVPLDYEAFRHHLLGAFREHFLEGFHLPDTLRLIAEDMDRRGLRPLLLIDDLVQSVNIFATDLLDYFLTLDEGNWDVVVGLTPAALAANDRGQELLDRITYLDTIDDRVEKLWLSDMEGHDSYFLTEETCVPFAARYLEAYRARNGWNCATCPRRVQCAGLGRDDRGATLAPFNQAVLRRLFRALPEGKGKARQFLRCLREVLEAVSEGQDLLDALSRRARLDFAVEADDPRLARLTELYGPLKPTDHRVILPAEILTAFGLPPQSKALPVEPLDAPKSSPGVSTLSSSTIDPERAAIKAWLDGKPVNRQSLARLRRGVARWLRAVCPVERLHAEGTARPHNVLRWHKVYLGVCPPVLLEEVDEGEGILLPREIGLAAFRLYDYATARGEESRALAAALSQEGRLLPLLFAAAAYRQTVLDRLEAQVGIKVEQLVLSLYIWLVVAEGSPAERPPGFGEEFWAQVEALHSQLSLRLCPLDEALRRAIQYLFEDFFKLRNNVYDGPRIARWVSERGPEMWLETLRKVRPDEVDQGYRLGERTLGEVLTLAQETIQRWKEACRTEDTLSPAARTVLEALKAKRGVPLGQVPSEVWEEIRTTMQEVYAALRVVTG